MKNKKSTKTHTKKYKFADETSKEILEQKKSDHKYNKRITVQLS